MEQLGVSNVRQMESCWWLDEKRKPATLTTKRKKLQPPLVRVCVVIVAQVYPTETCKLSCMLNVLDILFMIFFFSLFLEVLMKMSQVM